MTFYFWFINWFPDVAPWDSTVHSVKNKEKHIIFVSIFFEINPWNHNYLFIWCILLIFLFTCNFNHGIFFRSTNVLNKNLIFCCNNFMKSKFKFTYFVVCWKVLQIIKIIYIIDNYFKDLLFFKFVGNVECFYPFWVKIIHNYFCLAMTLPHITSFFI